MNENDVVTDKNFLLFCARNYNNVQTISSEEFFEDVKRIKYLKKLLTRFIEGGDLKERLILNHLIVLNNLFNSNVLCKILLLKMENYMNYLKPFLLFLNILPDKISNVKTVRVIDTKCIIMNEKVIEILKRMPIYGT